MFALIIQRIFLGVFLLTLGLSSKFAGFRHMGWYNVCNIGITTCGSQTSRRVRIFRRGTLHREKKKLVSVWLGQIMLG